MERQGEWEMGRLGDWGIGCRIPDTRCQVSDAGYQMPDTRCQISFSTVYVGIVFEGFRYEKSFAYLGD